MSHFFNKTHSEPPMSLFTFPMQIKFMENFTKSWDSLPPTLLPAPVYMCGFWSSFGRSKFTIVKWWENLRSSGAPEIFSPIYNSKFTPSKAAPKSAHPGAVCPPQGLVGTQSQLFSKNSGLGTPPRDAIVEENVCLASQDAQEVMLVSEWVSDVSRLDWCDSGEWGWN